jgi:hypothetical protein
MYLLCISMNLAARAEGMNLALPHWVSRAKGGGARATTTPLRGEPGTSHRQARTRGVAAAVGVVREAVVDLRRVEQGLVVDQRRARRDA